MMKSIFERALEIFGKEPQMRKCQEECAEVIVAINHNLLSRVPDTVVLEELADVRIMINQMALVLDSTGEEWEKIYEEKWQNLQKLVAQQEEVMEAGQ